MSKSIPIKIAVFTLLFYLFNMLALGISPTYAQENTKPKIITSQQSLYPDNPFYRFKRLGEKIAVKLLIFPDAKSNFQRSLVEKRFSELVYVVENNMLDNLQKSSERFAYEASIYAEGLTNRGTQEKTTAKEDFKRYTEGLQILSSYYPWGTGFWMLVQHDINTLTILQDRLR